MKRRQQTPKIVIGLRRVAALNESRWSGHAGNGGHTVSLGACLTLSQIVRDKRIAEQAAALWEAAAQIATPHLRSMGTLGGNLCLDTRCNYYDRTTNGAKRSTSA
jgi:4-hydroxybenzoyl-CoA reductase subunit beta